MRLESWLRGIGRRGVPVPGIFPICAYLEDSFFHNLRQVELEFLGWNKSNEFRFGYEKLKMHSVMFIWL